MKILILLIPLLAGCARQVVDPDTIAPYGSGGPTYIDQIRAEGDLDRAVSRLKWYGR